MDSSAVREAGIPWIHPWGGVKPECRRAWSIISLTSVPACAPLYGSMGNGISEKCPDGTGKRQTAASEIRQGVPGCIRFAAKASSSSSDPAVCVRRTAGNCTAERAREVSVFVMAAVPSAGLLSVHGV